MLNKLKTWYRNQSGFTQVLVAIIVVIVTVILIMVAAVIMSMFGSAIGNVSGLSAATNTTITSVTTSAYGALQLLTIVVYVLALYRVTPNRRHAVAIIGAVMGIFAYVRMKNE